MNVLNLFRPRRSAMVARERLQILLSHERNEAEQRHDLLSILREEILAVVARHVDISEDRVKVASSRDAHMSTLEIDIEIPRNARTRFAFSM